MDDVLGLVFLAGYILGILTLAAGVTLVVIKIFPTERNPKKAKPEKPDASPKNGSGEATGSLFRRSKRGRTS